MVRDESSLLAGNLQPPRMFARVLTVLSVTGLGRSTIYRWIADG